MEDFLIYFEPGECVVYIFALNKKLRPDIIGLDIQIQRRRVKMSPEMEDEDSLRRGAVIQTEPELGLVNVERLPVPEKIVLTSEKRFQ